MKVLYVYPTNRKEMYQKWKKRSSPSTLLYGFCELKKKGIDVHFIDTFGYRKTIFKYLFLPIEFLFFKLVGISLHFNHVYSQLKEIYRYDVIISASDSTSIPLLILKALGIIKKQKIICISIDLANRFNEIGLFLINFLTSLYYKSDKIIVFSKEEENIFIKKWKLQNVDFVQLGIDTTFFTREKDNTNYMRKDYALTVGRDRSRDYNFLFQVARALPSIKFIAICSRKNIFNQKIPCNVKIIIDAEYEEIMQWMKKSFCFLLPMRELHRASGQIAFLEAISAGLPTICSRANSLIDNYSFSEEQGVFFLPNEKHEWIKIINMIRNNKLMVKLNGAPCLQQLINAYKL